MAHLLNIELDVTVMSQVNSRLKELNCELKERAAGRGLFAVLVSKRATTKYPTAFQSQGELPGQTAAV